MTYIESKQKLDKIKNAEGEVMFRMALSHLIDVGVRHLSEENIAATCEEIQKEDDKKSFIKNDFKCKIVQTAGEFAKIDHIHLLAYVQNELYFDLL